MARLVFKVTTHIRNVADDEPIKGSSWNVVATDAEGAARRVKAGWDLGRHEFVSRVELISVLD